MGPMQRRGADTRRARIGSLLATFCLGWPDFEAALSPRETRLPLNDRAQETEARFSWFRMTVASGNVVSILVASWPLEPAAPRTAPLSTSVRAPVAASATPFPRRRLPL
jgi:hypothetical protein